MNPGFVMDVKGYSLLTGHPTRRESLWEDFRDLVAEEHRGKRNVYAEHLPPDAVTVNVVKTRPTPSVPSRTSSTLRVILRDARDRSHGWAIREG